MINEKRTVSGKLLEIDIYPVWKNGHRVPEKMPALSLPEQIKYNHRQCEKKLIRLVNVNFDSEDIIMHPTYSPENAPLDEEKARRDLKNYLSRIKRKRISELKKVIKLLDELPNTQTFETLRQKLTAQKKKLEAPFKYIYVIETVIYQRGPYKGLENFHFHLFVTGGLDRTVYEDMWKGGIRTNADRFQPKKYGPEAIAKYMAKSHRAGSKAYVCSRNIEDPDKEIKKTRLKPGGLERLAKQRADDKEYWEKRYKGYKNQEYRLLKTYPRYNKYNGHWYLTVIMYADSTDGMPDWKYDEW